MSAFVRDVPLEDIPPVIMPALQVNKLLKGQKALVTGANSGIGKSVAITLAQAGADVVVNYKSGDDQAKAVVDEAAKNWQQSLRPSSRCIQGRRSAWHV